MMFRLGLGAALAATALLVSPACRGDAGPQSAAEQNVAATVQVTVHTKRGDRQFHVEVARSVKAQERGLMFRTNIPADGGMLFAPYSAATGGPREASFWMKNTPTSLDIIFIRPNGTIAAIAQKTTPYSEVSSKSGEPVSAVLEILAGKSAELGIAPGDKVSWAGQ
jgi:uncharacterized protein